MSHNNSGDLLLVSIVGLYCWSNMDQQYRPTIETNNLLDNNRIETTVEVNNRGLSTETTTETLVSFKRDNDRGLYC